MFFLAMFDIINKFYIHPNAVSYIYQRSACTMDKLTDKDKNGLTAVTRSASVWMPRLDTTAVVRGRAQLRLNLNYKIIVICSIMISMNIDIKNVEYMYVLLKQKMKVRLSLV